MYRIVCTCCGKTIRTLAQLLKVCEDKQITRGFHSVRRDALMYLITKQVFKMYPQKVSPKSDFIDPDNGYDKESHRIHLEGSRQEISMLDDEAFAAALGDVLKSIPISVEQFVSQSTR